MAARQGSVSPVRLSSVVEWHPHLAERSPPLAPFVGILHSRAPVRAGGFPLRDPRRVRHGRERNSCCCSSGGGPAARLTVLDFVVKRSAVSQAPRSALKLFFNTKKELALASSFFVLPSDGIPSRRSAGGSTGYAFRVYSSPSTFIPGFFSSSSGAVPRFTAVHTSFSIAFMSFGFSRRYALAFSLPTPSFSSPKL